MILFFPFATGHVGVMAIIADHSFPFVGKHGTTWQPTIPWHQGLGVEDSSEKSQNIWLEGIKKLDIPGDYSRLVRLRAKMKNRIVTTVRNIAIPPIDHCTPMASDITPAKNVPKLARPDPITVKLCIRPR